MGVRAQDAPRGTQDLLNDAEVPTDVARAAPPYLLAALAVEDASESVV